MKSAVIGSAVFGAVTLGLLVLLLATRGWEAAALRGTGYGAALGLLNIVVSGWLLSWSMKNRPEKSIQFALGGFFFRLILLMGLTYAFWKNDGVDEMSFAVSFVIFFFVFLFIEIAILGRAAKRRTSNAGAES